MRSAKETGCFPYGSGQVCYMEVSPDGAVTQLSTVGEKRSAYINAQAGISKIFAVWPGRWRSDLFIIDDLDAFSEKQSLFGKYRYLGGKEDGSNENLLSQGCAALAEAASPQLSQGKEVSLQCRMKSTPKLLQS